MKVLKFGGSSVGSPEGLKQVEHILASYQRPLVVVVSAFQGVTNKLEEASMLASTKDATYKTLLTEISNIHTTAINSVVTTTEPNHSTFYGNGYA